MMPVGFHLLKVCVDSERLGYIIGAVMKWDMLVLNSSQTCMHNVRWRKSEIAEPIYIIRNVDIGAMRRAVF